MHVAKPYNEPDRWVLFYVTKKSIRDVIAFLKVQNACELNPNSHLIVQDNQLKNLNIKIKE